MQITKLTDGPIEGLMRQFKLELDSSGGYMSIPVVDATEQRCSSAVIPLPILPRPIVPFFYIFKGCTAWPEDGICLDAAAKSGNSGINVVFLTALPLRNSGKQNFWPAALCRRIPGNLPVSGFSQL